MSCFFPIGKRGSVTVLKKHDTNMFFYNLKCLLTKIMFKQKSAHSLLLELYFRYFGLLGYHEGLNKFTLHCSFVAGNKSLAGAFSFLFS